MVDISFEHDIASWTRDFDASVARQLPYITSLALTDTAHVVRDRHREVMRQIFDRPTPYTINSLQVTPSRKETLVSRVYFKDQVGRSQHYLVPQVEGGGRPHKRFERWLIAKGVMQPGEYAVPASGARLNSYGNMSPGSITQILSQLAASPDAMQWETAKSRKRAGARRARYFVPKPGSKLARGIWVRRGKSSIAPVLLFVGGVGYRPRYDFDGISRETAAEWFPSIFESKFVQVLGRAR